MRSTRLIIPFSVCGINSQSTWCFAISQNQQGLLFLQSDTNFMNTILFAIHVKIISVCFKVFVECTICSVSTKRFPLFNRFPLTPLRVSGTFEGLCSWNPQSLGGTNFQHALLAYPLLDGIINIVTWESPTWRWEGIICNLK